MSNQHALEEIFRRLRSGETPNNEILALRSSLSADDTGWLMQRVAALTGPYEFMQDIDETDADDNRRSELIADGYFKFIDLVSCLIMDMGEDAIATAQRFEGSGHYVPWVQRYCTDARFAEEVRRHFPFLDG